MEQEMSCLERAFKFVFGVTADMSDRDAMVRIGLLATLLFGGVVFFCYVFEILPYLFGVWLLVIAPVWFWMDWAAYRDERTDD